MRTPTNLYEAFGSWRRRLAGENLPVHLDLPEPGFYRTRLIRGGQWVSVAIWLSQEIDPDTGLLLSDERLLCIVDKEPRDPQLVWNYCCGNPISEEDYRALEERGARARVLAPDSPYANPRRASSVAELPSLF